jgi:hypothetical protein
MRASVSTVLAFVVPLLLVGCGSGTPDSSAIDPRGGTDIVRPPDGQPPPTDWPTDDLAGGVVATFEVAGETFSVWVVNEETIRRLEEDVVRVVQSVVRRGPGNCEHNLPWSWHLDPLSTFVEDTDIGCRAHAPSQVEANLEDWLSTYCMLVLSPVQLVDLRDYR